MLDAQRTSIACLLHHSIRALSFILQAFAGSLLLNSLSTSDGGSQLCHPLTAVLVSVIQTTRITAKAG